MFGKLDSPARFGTRGRRFKSCRPDQIFKNPQNSAAFSLAVSLGFDWQIPTGEPSARCDLQELSDTIGGRVTASLADARAAQWALTKMRSLGLAHSALEPWSLQRGWTRGHAGAEIVAPIRRRLTVASMGWSGSTPRGGAAAPLMAVDRNALDDPNATRRWAGHILLPASGSPSHDTFSIYPRLAAFVRLAQRLGAVAVLGQMTTAMSAGSHSSHRVLDFCFVEGERSDSVTAVPSPQRQNWPTSNQRLGRTQE